MYSRTLLTVLAIFCLCYKGIGGEKCKKFALKVNKAQTCDTANNIITTNGTTAAISETCGLTPLGCVTVAKDVNTFNVKFEATQLPLFSLKVNIDVCKNVQYIPDFIKVGLQAMGVPTSCPVKASTICLTNKDLAIDISPFAPYIPILMGSPVNLKLEGQYDSGAGCFEAEFEIVPRSSK